MGKSQMRVRPGMMWVLLGTILLSPAVLFVLPKSNADRKAEITITRFWVKNIAGFLIQQAVETGSLTHFDKHSIAQSEFGSNNFRPQWTNSLGESIDYWKTSFKIEILARTNFIIRSAGPNQKFGDADDIIFNSVSNDFVKP